MAFELPVTFIAAPMPSNLKTCISPDHIVIEKVYCLTRDDGTTHSYCKLRTIPGDSEIRVEIPCTLFNKAKSYLHTDVFAYFARQYYRPKDDSSSGIIWWVVDFNV